MNKRELMNDMKNTFNGAGLLTVGKVAQYIGMERKTARRLLADVDYIQRGKKKYYYVGDVADKLLKRKD